MKTARTVRKNQEYGSASTFMFIHLTSFGEATKEGPSSKSHLIIWTGANERDFL